MRVLQNQLLSYKANMFRLASFHTRRAHGSYNAIRLSHIAQAMATPMLHNTINSLGTSELCSIISNEQDISRIFDIFTNAKVNGPSPNRRLLRALIAACKNHPERMHDLFLDMEKYNITPTAIIYSKFIQAAVTTQNKSFLTDLCKSQSRSHIKQQSELSIQLVQACAQLGQLEMIHQAAFPTNTIKPSMSLLMAVMEAAKTKPLAGIQVWEVLREQNIVPDYSFVHQFLHLLVRIGYYEERTNQVVDITLDILKCNNEYPELHVRFIFSH
jgi:hypothetical protein